MEKFNKKKILFLIPAREGSKGVKNKNIKNFFNKKSLTEIYSKTNIKFLITSFTGDWLYPPSENLMIVRALSAGGADVSFVNINSDKGHDAFLLEEPEFDDAMRGFINSVSLEADI